MYAIIKTGGKQYRVQEGDNIFVEKLDADVDSNVVFDQVLAVVNDGDVKVGAPVVEGAKVTAKVLAQGKEKKILVFKYKGISLYGIYHKRPCRLCGRRKRYCLCRRIGTVTDCFVGSHGVCFEGRTL